jgi:N-acyl-D-aspartate/D-glutamate deacylase
VIDGTGRSTFAADIAVTRGRITDIGVLPSWDGVPCLAARGHSATPGFIDIHSHSDFTLLVDPRAVSRSRKV